MHPVALSIVGNGALVLHIPITLVWTSSLACETAFGIPAFSPMYGYEEMRTYFALALSLYLQNVGGKRMANVNVNESTTARWQCSKQQHQRIGGVMRRYLHLRCSFLPIGMGYAHMCAHNYSGMFVCILHGLHHEDFCNFPANVYRDQHNK